MDRIWKYLILIFTMIIIDQLSKAYIQQHFAVGESIPVIKGFFNITYVQNPGAAFGFGANASTIIRRILFWFIPVLACMYLVYFIWKTRKGPVLLGTIYSLILAGAVGNLWDRFTLDYVVDFLDFYWKTSHFPAFNVADSCITVAGVLYFIEIIYIKSEPKYFASLKKDEDQAQQKS